MEDLAIGVQGNDGVGIIIRKGDKKEKQPPTFVDENDALVKKVIPSQLKFSRGPRGCEVKCPANNEKLAIAVFGTSDGRPQVFNFVSDEIRRFVRWNSSPIPTLLLADCTRNIVQSLANMNPVEALLASWSEERGGDIYCVYTNGDNFKCRACAIGDNSQKIKDALADLDFNKFTTREIIGECVKMIKEFYGEGSGLKISWLSRETKRNHRTLKI